MMGMCFFALRLTWGAALGAAPAPQSAPRPTFHALNRNPTFQVPVEDTSCARAVRLSRRAAGREMA